MSAPQGWPSQQKKYGNSQFVSVQSTGSTRNALDVVSRGVTQVVTDVVEAGSTPNIIVATAHSAQHGMLIRFTSGVYSGREFGVYLVTANSIQLYADLLVSTVPTAPSPGDTFAILRYVTPAFASDGSIVATSGPLQVNVDGSPQTVNYNTGTPASSIPVPVYITGGGSSSGALDFGASSAAARTAAQIGNATGAAAFGAGNSSAQTLRTVIATDQSALPITVAALPLPAGAATETTLAAMSAKLPATLGQKVMASSLAVVLASDQAAIPVTVSGVATAANQASELTLIGAVTETAPATDTASSGLNGRLQRIAQRLTSLIALLPASLGQKTMANSLAVTLASDQSAFPVTSTRVLSPTMGQLTAAVTAQTLTAPANAKGFTIQNSARATSAVRWRESSIAASVTVGFLLEPGQSTSYQDGAASISVFAVDGTAIDVAVAWFV